MSTFLCKVVWNLLQLPPVRLWNRNNTRSIRQTDIINSLLTIKSKLVGREQGTMQHKRNHPASRSPTENNKTWSTIVQAHQNQVWQALEKQHKTVGNSLPSTHKSIFTKTAHVYKHQKGWKINYPLSYSFNWKRMCGGEDAGRGEGVWKKPWHANLKQLGQACTNHRF